MATILTVTDVRAAITAPASGPAHPAGPTVADVRARLYGHGQRHDQPSGDPAARATTEKTDGSMIHGDGTDPAPALDVPARAAGPNTGDPANDTYAPIEYPGSPLAHDMPGHAALAAAGIDTLEDLRAVADLTQIDGIGPATARKIQEWLEANP